MTSHIYNFDVRLKLTLFFYRIGFYIATGNCVLRQLKSGGTDKVTVDSQLFAWQKSIDRAHLMNPVTLVTHYGSMKTWMS